jgi:hypothetical protein
VATPFWISGDPMLGKWQDATDGRCGSPGVSGSQFTFTLSYTGGSCVRNQAKPLQSDGVTISELAIGSTYSFIFDYIDGTPADAAPGMGMDCGVYPANCPAGTGQGDSRSLVWQIHAQPDTSPCTYLGFSNGPVPGVTTPQKWVITDCGSNAGSQQYRWTDTYTPQEVDYWCIQVKVAQDATGFVKVWRNGINVFNDINVKTVNAPTKGSLPPWWDFGPYKWIWAQNPTMSNMSSVNMTNTYMRVYIDGICP